MSLWKAKMIFWNRIEPHLPQPIRSFVDNLELFHLVRWALVVAVLFLSAVFIPYATFTGRRMLLMAAALPLAAFAGYFVLRWTNLLLPLILVSGLMVRFAVGTGTQTQLNGAVLMIAAALGLWVFKMIATRQINFLPPHRTFWPAVGFMLAAVISFGFGQFEWYPISGASITAQVGGLMLFLLSAGIYIYIIYNTDEGWQKWMLAIFLAIGGIITLSYLVPPLDRVRSFIPVGALQSLFWTWFPVLALSQALLNRDLPLPVRGLLGILCAGCLYIAFFISRAWTSGWLPGMVAIAVFLFCVWPRLGLLGGLVVGVVLFFNWQQAQSTVMVGDNEYSLVTRLEAWKIVLQVISVNPIFGLGPSNYYWYTRLFPIMGYYVVFNSHNNYVDILGQTGLLGLLFFLWFAWETGITIWRGIFQAVNSFQKAFLCACLGGLAGTMAAAMLGDWVVPFVYNIGFEGFRSSIIAWLFLGGAVAVCRQLSLAQTDSSESSGQSGSRETSEAV